MADAPGLLAQRDGPDVQLLDLVYSPHSHAAFRRDRQAVREARAVKAGHEVHLKAKSKFKPQD
eukprot:scaffold180313_cov41-Prasinocladus_malaysianus.AAC.1